MGVGTNENVKNTENKKIQDIEKVEKNVKECNIEVNTNDSQDKNFNSDNAQKDTNSAKIIEPNFQLVNDTQEQKQTQQMQDFNMQKTQKIEILNELLKDTEKSKKELVENLKSEKVEENKKVELNQDIPKKQNIEQIEPSNPEDIDKKEKQHVQDKKDFRLERMLFDRINKMQGKIKESLELIKKFERINAKEENLPNIVTTLHDKLTQEVIKQFRTVGIEFNMKSYLVQSIVSDLLNKFEEGITEFKDCSENLNFVREVQEDFESRVEIAPTSKVKNIFARLRGLFKPERKQERLEQLERERQEKKLEEANIHLIKYKFINSELERYTIRKNIVNSLTREILHGQGSGLTLNITQFINEKIESEMKMLGLEGLLPELKEKLFEEYKEKFNEMEKEDFFNLSVGEVKKNIKFSRVGYLRSKVSVITNTESKDEERMVV